MGCVAACQTKDDETNLQGKPSPTAATTNKQGGKQQVQQLELSIAKPIAVEAEEKNSTRAAADSDSESEDDFIDKDDVDELEAKLKAAFEAKDESAIQTILTKEIAEVIEAIEEAAAEGIEEDLSFEHIKKDLDEVKGGPKEKIIHLKELMKPITKAQALDCERELAQAVFRSWKTNANQMRYAKVCSYC
jgi:hypothetical protein